MEYRYDLCCSVPKYLVLILVLIRCSVNGDSQCKNLSDYRVMDGEIVDDKYCARNLSCLQYIDKIDIHWNQPEIEVIDVIINLEGIEIDGIPNSVNSRTIIQVNNTVSNIEWIRTDRDQDRHYSTTINIRYIDVAKAYSISKACKKVVQTTTTSKRSTNSVKEQQTTDSLVSTTHSQGTTKLTKASDKTSSYDRVAETGTLSGRSLLFFVIGSSVAGVVLLLVIVVIIVMLRKKKQSKKEIVIKKGKQNTDVEQNGPDEDDTYNHLSFDNQDRETKRAKQKSYLQDNEADEEGTYNHLSCDNQDRKTKIAKQNSEHQDSNADEECTYNHLSRDNQERKTKLAKQNSYLKNNEVDEEGTYSHMSRDCQETRTSMAQGNEEDTYNHLSLSQKTEKIETMSCEINVISVSVHAPTTLESAGKNEEIQVKTEKGNETNTVVGNDDTESAAGFKQLDSLEDAFKEPSRRKGPKGDLYTEIGMK